MIRAIALATGLVVTLSAGVADAHDESVSTSEITVDGARLTWTVDVGLAGLAKVVSLPGVPVAGELEDVPAVQVAARRVDIARYLASRLTIRLDGQPATARPGSLRMLTETLPDRSAPAITRIALELEFQAARPIEKVEARVAFFSELTASHRAVLRVRWGEERAQMTRLGATDLVLERGRVEPSVWRLALDFVAWGIHHIVIGYDHIAFLLALLLAVGRVRQLVFIVTAFTLAHSLTILLAALDVVRMPAAITEALIAASIVYVAAENLVLGDRAPRGRAVLAFLFGLVHGLGFAEVLRDRLAEAPGGVVGLVIAFNLGVEIGQLAIVAVAFPLLVLLRRRFGERRVLRVGSTGILVLGVMWLVGRLL